MDRLHLEIDPNDHRELKKLTGSVSEHVRNAIKEYIQRQFKVSTTPTKGVSEGVSKT